MAKAFTPKAGCPVPGNDALDGDLLFGAPVVPPDSIIEYPFFDFPPPEPPGFDFGCYAPSVFASLNAAGPSTTIDPCFDAVVSFPETDDTGNCQPRFDFNICIPPCPTLGIVATASFDGGVVVPTVSFTSLRRVDEPCSHDFTFDLKIPPPGGAASSCTARMASTGSLTLSGLQTVDGVVGSSGNLVLVKDQVAPADNGVYSMSAGAWTRSGGTTSGNVCSVREGTTNGGSAWILTTNDPITVGVTGLTYDQVGPSCCCSARLATTDPRASPLTGLAGAVDGFSLSAGNVVLVKNQAVASENGVYIASAGAWTRTCEIFSGHLVSVRQGNRQALTVWMLETNPPITLDSTSLTYRQTVDHCEARVATDIPITLSGTGASIDGVTVAAGDHVLATAQTPGSANGIYIVRTGAWDRACSLTPGKLVHIRAGTANTGSVWMLTNSVVIVGVVTLTFVKISGGDPRIKVRASSTTVPGGGTADGITLTTNDLILVFAGGAANGIYRFTSPSTYDKIQSFVIADADKLISVREGNLRGPSLWLVTAADTIKGIVGVLGGP
jgi:hypothetical protein